MCATSATNVAQNVAQFYLYFKYKFHQWRVQTCTRALIKHGEINVQTCTRALIKHGEIGEDSIAAPEKLNHQPFAKK